MSDQSVEQIYNFRRLSEKIGTAGQPTAEQFAAVKAAGYQLVVNLRPCVPDALPNEQALVEAQGLEYVHIPVIWEQPTLEDFEQFVATMDANAGRPIFVHCAANMRVSAFMYLYRVLKQNVAPEVAEKDLHAIWEPEGVWKAFVAQTLTQNY